MPKKYGLFTSRIETAINDGRMNELEEIYKRDCYKDNKRLKSWRKFLREDIVEPFIRRKRK